MFEFVVDDCELEIVADRAGPKRADRRARRRRASTAVAVAPPRVAESNAAPRRPESSTAVAAAARAGQGRSRQAGSGGEPPTIRVDLERVDRLINLVGELVINQAMLSQRVLEAGLARSSSVAAGLGALEQLTREIQEGVMAIRAQPVKPLFQRMSRIVRELADATGKIVRLRTEGEATEVDRTVIERLADPLTHMIRNAVDHGLEPPEDARSRRANRSRARCSCRRRTVRAASSSKSPTTAPASIAQRVQARSRSKRS